MVSLKPAGHTGRMLWHCPEPAESEKVVVPSQASHSTPVESDEVVAAAVGAAVGAGANDTVEAQICL